MSGKNRNLKIAGFLGVVEELGAEPVDIASMIFFDIGEWIDSLSPEDLADFIEVDSLGIKICENNLHEFRSSAARWACVKDDSLNGLAMLVVASAPGAFVSCAYDNQEAIKYIMESRPDAVMIAQRIYSPNP